MATDHSAAMRTAPTYPHHAYKTSISSQYSPYSPLGSGPNTPSSNVSPTSPRSAHLPMPGQHAPQIRRPKNPIYVPAALRRTEVPVRHSPPKIDAGVNTPNGSWGASGAFGTVAGDGSQTLTPITSEDMNSIYGDTPLSPVNGPITRNHWQPDGSTAVCTASACQAPFGMFNRRHHCRKCGGIFCSQHSQRHVPLNEDALFHPEGSLERACDRCFTQYQQWEKMRTSRQNSGSSGSSTTAVQIAAPAMKRPENNRVGSIANSFSGAWNWSTF